AYLSLLTFYYNGFLLLGQCIGALVVRRQVPRLTAALAGVGIALIPFIPTILAQSHTHPIEVPAAEFSALIKHPLFVVAGTPIRALLTDTAAFDLPHALLIIWAILALVPIVRFVSGGKPDTAELALIPAVIVPLVALGALMYLKLVPIRHRHFVMMLPATLTLLSVWLAHTRAGAPRMLTGTLLAALLLGFVVSFEIDPQYPEDWRQVADYLTRQAAPGERVLVFDPDRVLPLDYYLG